MPTWPRGSRFLQISWTLATLDRHPHDLGVRVHELVANLRGELQLEAGALDLHDDAGDVRGLARGEDLRRLGRARLARLELAQRVAEHPGERVAAAARALGGRLDGAQ